MGLQVGLMDERYRSCLGKNESILRLMWKQLNSDAKNIESTLWLIVCKWYVYVHCISVKLLQTTLVIV